MGAVYWLRPPHASPAARAIVEAIHPQLGSPHLVVGDPDTAVIPAGFHQVLTERLGAVDFTPLGRLRVVPFPMHQRSRESLSDAIDTILTERGFDSASWGPDLEVGEPADRWFRSADESGASGQVSRWGASPGAGLVPARATDARSTLPHWLWPGLVGSVSDGFVQGLTELFNGYLPESERAAAVDALRLLLPAQGSTSGSQVVSQLGGAMDWIPGAGAMVQMFPNDHAMHYVPMLAYARGFTLQFVERRRRTNGWFSYTAGELIGSDGPVLLMMRITDDSGPFRLAPLFVSDPSVAARLRYAAGLVDGADRQRVRLEQFGGWSLRLLSGDGEPMAESVDAPTQIARSLMVVAASPQRFVDAVLAAVDFLATAPAPARLTPGVDAVLELRVPGLTVRDVLWVVSLRALRGQRGPVRVAVGEVTPASMRQGWAEQWGDEVEWGDEADRYIELLDAAGDTTVPPLAAWLDVYPPERRRGDRLPPPGLGQPYSMRRLTRREGPAERPPNWLGDYRWSRPNEQLILRVTTTELWLRPQSMSGPEVAVPHVPVPESIFAPETQRAGSGPLAVVFGEPGVLMPAHHIDPLIQVVESAVGEGAYRWGTQGQPPRLHLVVHVRLGEFWPPDLPGRIEDLNRFGQSDRWRDFAAVDALTRERWAQVLPTLRMIVDNFGTGSRRAAAGPAAVAGPSGARWAARPITTLVAANPDVLMLDSGQQDTPMLDVTATAQSAISDDNPATRRAQLYDLGVALASWHDNQVRVHARPTVGACPTPGSWRCSIRPCGSSSSASCRSSTICP